MERGKNQRGKVEWGRAGGRLRGKGVGETRRMRRGRMVRGMEEGRGGRCREQEGSGGT